MDKAQQLIAHIIGPQCHWLTTHFHETFEGETGIFSLINNMRTPALLPSTRRLGRVMDILGEISDGGETHKTYEHPNPPQ